MTILNAQGKPYEAPKRRPSRGVRARYDVAQTTEENRKHWALADDLSADAAMSPGIRRIVRKRARYERDNNSYVSGVTDFLAADTIGADIILQVNTNPKGSREGAVVPSRDDASYIERQFGEWLEATSAIDVFSSGYGSQVTDGESFVQMVTNPRLGVPVKLDLISHESEMVQGSRATETVSERYNDGIWYDRWQNPTTYEVQTYHPGGSGLGLDSHVNVPARDMCHLFWARRPGQRRGMSEILAGLPLCAMLRRWTLAVLAAAETAADFAAVLQTDGDPYSDDYEVGEAFENLEIVRRMMTTLPAGYELKQFKAEQPVSGYREFKRELVTEFGNAVRVPAHLALGDASEYNYASVRMDNQTYVKLRKKRRGMFRRQCLDRVFAAWWREAVLIEEYIPQRLRSINVDLSHNWIFDGDPHVDPVKEANAQAIRLANGTSTLTDEWGLQGADVDDKLEQIAREREAMDKLGINLAFVEVADDSDESSDDDNDDDVTASAPVSIKRDASGRILGFSGDGLAIERDASGKIAGFRSTT